MRFPSNSIPTSHGKTVPVQWIPSQNFDARDGADIDTIVIHYTACDFDISLKALTEPSESGSVSAHYLIDENGLIFQLVHEEDRAWHAGISSWKGMTKSNLNYNSLGIELVNDGFSAFSTQQVAHLVHLLRHLQKNMMLRETTLLVIKILRQTVK